MILRAAAPALFALPLLVATQDPPAQAATFTLANEVQPQLAELVRLYDGDPRAHPLAIENPDEPFFSAHNVIRMEGPIEAGDAARFDALYAQLFEDTGRYPYVLVMNSPGGNFLAGIELGAALGNNAYEDALRLKAVVVLEGERCLSACALAFALAGARSDGEPRMIASGGLVGFHMGILPEKTQRSQAEVGQIMGLTYDIMQSYLGLLRDGRNPLTLLYEALQHRTAGSFFLLGAEPRALDLGFVPVGRGALAAPVQAAALDLDTLGSLCNSAEWAQPGLVDEISYDFWSHPGYMGQDRFNAMTLAEALPGPGAVLMAQLGNGSHCFAGIGADGAVRMQALQVNAPDYDSMPKPARKVAGQWFEAGANSPALADLPPVTTALLAEALGCPDGRLAQGWEDWMADHHPEDRAPPRPFPDTLPIKRAVSLRAAPGLDAERLGELPAGSQIAVQDCRVTTGNQGVWYQITHAGQTGWISARFASMLGTDTSARPIHTHVLTGNAP
ncbi:hypothetical protein CKO11_04225 [Rhodobacter sp. TJ_12]|uniref:SH3 domain-containing protein n=1 Tax=Rhodobacter sp. TJ_12 TaxID=2029399 RepID=UPI001CBBDFD4|nr:SH3 domain-containing protein [Rhodobacter sp. TJ_12]MBZ4021666.1 hypothetical protein [Rhodobacter sp. TJ_12]